MLAAGRGTRFGAATKLLQPLHARPIVRRSVEAACASGLSPVVVVVSDAAVAASVAEAVGTVRVVENPDPARGLTSSLRLALEALLDEHITAVVIGLGDQPLVGPEAYRRLAAAGADGADLAVATYGGVRANPVLVGRDLWHDVTALTGDVGVRAIMRDHAVRDVRCDGTGDPADVDRPDDLRALEARCASTTSS